MTTPAEILSMLKEKEVKFVDLRFTDTRGKEQHVTVPSHTIDSAFFDDGKMFDGSSISRLEGHQRIRHGADAGCRQRLCSIRSAEHTTLFLRLRCARAERRCKPTRVIRARLAKRAEAFLKSSGIADTRVLRSREPEFFIFDNVRYGTNGMNAARSSRSNPIEAAWSSNKKFEAGNTGASSGREGWVFPGAAGRFAAGHPQRAMCKVLEAMGHDRRKCITTKLRLQASARSASTFNTHGRARPMKLLNLKYVDSRMSRTAYGKTATFMPKPIVGDNGSRHACAPVAREGRPERCLPVTSYGGPERSSRSGTSAASSSMHKAINAFTNSTTNSYKRLVPGL